MEPSVETHTDGVLHQDSQESNSPVLPDQAVPVGQKETLSFPIENRLVPVYGDSQVFGEEASGTEIMIPGDQENPYAVLDAVSQHADGFRIVPWDDGTVFVPEIEQVAEYAKGVVLVETMEKIPQACVLLFLDRFRMMAEMRVGYEKGSSRFQTTSSLQDLTF